MVHSFTPHQHLDERRREEWIEGRREGCLKGVREELSPSPSPFFSLSLSSLGEE